MSTFSDGNDRENDFIKEEAEAIEKLKSCFLTEKELLESNKVRPPPSSPQRTIQPH